MKTRKEAEEEDVYGHDRAVFEHWVCSHNYSRGKRVGGSYEHPKMDWWFEIWQAACRHKAKHIIDLLTEVTKELEEDKK